MDTLFCSACSMENDRNTAKCEHCKNTLSDENCSALDEWEEDFRFIEEAELKGEVYKLESLGGTFRKLEPFEKNQITQDIKEEPEIQIEPDIVVDEQIDYACVIKFDESVQLKYQCNECTKSFNRKATLTAHFNAEHSRCDTDSGRPIAKRKSLSSNPKITVHKCRSCNKITKDYEEHKNHVQSHENLGNILPSGLTKCKYCSKTFANNFDLKMHQNQHEGKKVFQCNVCQAFLSNDTVLKQHKIKLHSENTVNNAEEKKYRCVFCGERFPLQILMVNHKKTHKEDSKQLEETAIIRRVDGRLTYICKMCGKSSSNKSRHTDHIRVHTKEKPFKCDLCGAGFTARGSLVHHLRLHSDERPFKCHICDATYRHKKNLRKHLYRHTGARPFECEYCGKTFALNSIKVDHVRLLHTGETPYQCEVCEHWFTTSYLLNAHRRANHDINTNSKPRVEILINKIASSDDESSSEVKQ